MANSFFKSNKISTQFSTKYVNSSNKIYMNNPLKASFNAL